MWPRIYDSAKGFSLGNSQSAAMSTGSIGNAARKEAADGRIGSCRAENDATERKGDESLRVALDWKI
jgi:hypothetical protein